MSRPRLIAAVRERMRRLPATRHAEHTAVTPAPARRTRRARPVPPDPRIEQLAAEAQYHRERFELHRARVISGSPAATTLGRLRDLERTANSAQERLVHARRAERRGE
jgi:hypothetical protein